MTSWRKTRELVYARDGGRCVKCSVKLATDNWECDHIYPKEEGGTDDLDNLRCLCVSCHKIETSEYARRRAAGKKTKLIYDHGQVVPRKKKRKWPSRKVPSHSKGLDAQRYGEGP